MPASNETESGRGRPAEHARRGRPVLDGAAFGVYEDEDEDSRGLRIIAVVLAIATVGVGALVWRAVNTDAGIEVPSDAAPSTTPDGQRDDAADAAPSEKALRALIPPGLDTCSRLGEPPDGPPRVSLLCPRTGTPEAVGFVLFATIADREDEFDRLVTELGVPSRGSDCALGPPAVHDFVGFDRVGRVACALDGELVDFAWTTDEAPLLVRARGPGSFSDHYAFWDRVVQRTDGTFPLAAERDLLAALPEELSDDCRRDLDRDVGAGGTAAVVCEPEGAEPESVSSVQFDDDDDMAAWIDDRRSALTGNVLREADDACTPAGFGGQPDTETTTPGPIVDAGAATYARDGRTGEVVCYVGDGRNVVVWTRDDTRIGSVAVSDRSTGASMRALLEWWTSAPP